MEIKQLWQDQLKKQSELYNVYLTYLWQYTPKPSFTFAVLIKKIHEKP